MAEFDDDLYSILSGNNSYIDSNTRSLAREKQKLQQDIERAGYSPDAGTPRQSLFWDVLDTLDAPRQGVAGVADAFARGDFGTEKVGTGWRRGQIENTSTSDVLGHLGVEDPLVRAIGGFAGDVLTDPLSWLSFGASGAAKAGGRALTETGLALKTSATARAEQAARFLPGLSDEADAVIKGDDLLNQAFVGASRHQQALKALEKASTPATIEAAQHDISKAMDMYKGVLEPSEVVGSDIFNKSVFRIERELPFLGNIMNPVNRAREAIHQDQGPVGQALRMAGAVWNPGKVNIAEINIPENLIDAFDNIRMYSNEKLMKVGDTIASLPIVGAPAAMAGNFVKELGSLSRKIFMQKSLVGADVNNNRLRYIDYVPAAKQSARDMVADTYGDLLKDTDAMKEGLLAYDAQMIGSMQTKAQQAAQQRALTKTTQGATWENDLLETVNKNLREGKVSDDDIKQWQNFSEMTNADQEALNGVQTLLNDPNIPSNVKQVIQKTHDLTTTLRQSELDSGVDLGYVAAYIPHRFVAGISGDASTLRRATTGSFTKERSYESLAQAFEEGGKVADLNLASIMEQRINNSLLMQGQRNFFNRLAIEEGLDPRIVTNLYKEARADPTGAAAKMLQKKRLYFSPVKTEAIQEGVQMAERQKLYSKAGKGDTAASNALHSQASDVQQKVNEELWLAGQKPLDNKLAQEALGEMGDVITIPGGKEQAYLPKPMADMYKEAIAGKDFIKSKFGESSRFGKTAVNLYDYMANFTRKMVTIPFPAYYFQNALGASFQSMMNGAATVNPGLPMRVASVLAGKSTITSANGTKLTQPVLKKIAQQFGLKYDANSYLDGIDSFTRTDPTKLLQRKNAMWENLKGGNIATGLAQAQEKVNGGFENYLRMTEFVNRFEKGDSIADAARTANQTYFNYRDMSPIEKSLAKRFYMFYGFTSKATGQTLNNLLFAPSNLNLQINGSKAMAEAFAGSKPAPTADEADIRLLSNAIDSESISHVIGRSESGKPITARGFAAPLQQVLQTFSLQRPNSWNVGEVLNAGVDSIRRTAQKQFANANPMFNSAIQNLTNKNLYFDKPLDSEFLRKLPSYEAIAAKVTDSNFAKIPARLLDDAQKKLLGARDNGDGTMTADPGWFWVATQLVPALSRAVSSAKWLADEDIPGRTGLMRALTGINISDTDPTRTYLYDQVNSLRDFSKRQGVKKKLELMRDEGDNAE